MSGHELFNVATAALLAMNGNLIGKNQHFSFMAAIGAQKVKKWHISLPFPSIPVAKFHLKSDAFNSNHLKNRIWVLDQGGTGFQPAGILSHVEDSKPGTSAGVGPKDSHYVERFNF